MKKLLILALLTSLFFFSCRKENNDSNVIVQSYSPYYKIPLSTFTLLLITSANDPRIDKNEFYLFMDRYESNVRYGSVFFRLGEWKAMGRYLGGLNFYDEFPFETVGGSRYRFIVKASDITPFLVNNPKVPFMGEEER